MSILSSTQSGIYSHITKEYLLSHGYVQNEMSKIKDAFFYRWHVGSAHVIETFEYKGELVYCTLAKGGIPGVRGYIYINNIKTLKEVERMWDARGIERSKLIRQLFENNKEIQ